jgi:riboflavin kinase/FMN adenylyltransferase
MNSEMEGYVATIGMFDGVHRGHQFVLQHVADEARQRGLQSMAITFDKSGPQTLTPLDQKRLLLTKTGIDRIEVLTFNEALKQMTAREFMEQELRDRLNVKVLLTGYDNRFGHNRTEGFEDYVRYGKELGIEVKSLPPAPSKGRGCIESPKCLSNSTSCLVSSVAEGMAMAL